jgi:hypothetical protein
MFRRIGALALVALAAGGYASARNGSLALQPTFAPAPEVRRPVLPRVVVAPAVHARVRQTVRPAADPLRSFCRYAQRVRAAYESRRPQAGSPASVYIPFLVEGARMEAALAERLEPAPARFRRLAARRVELARALVDAANRRDVRAYWATVDALAANARAARAVSRCVG